MVTGTTAYKCSEVRNGSEIVYTVTEDVVKNYTQNIDGTTITNSYTPGKTSVSVTKAWEDNNNQDGKRPDSVQVQLCADGEAKGESVTLSSENNWSHTWTDLDEMANQEEIKYTVKEVSIPEGYTCKITGTAEKGILLQIRWILKLLKCLVQKLG